jgi:hypothetical protein
MEELVFSSALSGPRAAQRTTSPPPLAPVLRSLPSQSRIPQDQSSMINLQFSIINLQFPGPCGDPRGTRFGSIWRRFFQITLLTKCLITACHRDLYVLHQGHRRRQEIFLLRRPRPATTRGRPRDAVGTYSGLIGTYSGLIRTASGRASAVERPWFFNARHRPESSLTHSAQYVYNHTPRSSTAERRQPGRYGLARGRSASLRPSTIWSNAAGPTRVARVRLTHPS